MLLLGEPASLGHRAGLNTLLTGISCFSSKQKQFTKAHILTSQDAAGIPLQKQKRCGPPEQLLQSKQ